MPPSVRFLLELFITGFSCLVVTMFLSAGELVAKIISKSSETNRARLQLEDRCDRGIFFFFKIIPFYRVSTWLSQHNYLPFHPHSITHRKRYIHHLFNIYFREYPTASARRISFPIYILGHTGIYPFHG